MEPESHMNTRLRSSKDERAHQQHLVAVMVAVVVPLFEQQKETMKAAAAIAETQQLPWNTHSRES
jgi:hypothetical protein